MPAASLLPDGGFLRAPMRGPTLFVRCRASESVTNEPPERELNHVFRGQGAHLFAVRQLDLDRRVVDAEAPLQLARHG